MKEQGGGFLFLSVGAENWMWGNCCGKIWQGSHLYGSC